MLKLQQSALPRADLAALLERLEQSRPADLAWLHTGAGNTIRVLSVTEVLYFRAADKCTDVVTAAGRHVIRTSLKDLMRQLDPERLAQVHRGIVVNLHCVERLERDVLGRLSLYLKGHPDVLPLSPNAIRLSTPPATQIVLETITPRTRLLIPAGPVPSISVGQDARNDSPAVPAIDAKIVIGRQDHGVG